MQKNISILIIYTGGTIGMKQNPETGALSPFNFEQIEQEVPELRKFGFDLHTYSFEPPIDSSDITPDGKENLISAVEIAAAQQNGQPMVPEVTIFFENRLYRGNRTTKHNAEHFNAFRSDNYPFLAEAGITIKYNFPFIHYTTGKQDLRIHTKLDSSIGVLKLFPGITPEIAKAVTASKGVKAIVIETFGSGNALSRQWFLDIISEAVKNNIIILNVTQCKAGSVDMDKYENGLKLKNIGVVSGYDITFEAAIAKLMFLMGKGFYGEKLAKELTKSISGEITLH